MLLCQGVPQIPSATPVTHVRAADVVVAPHVRSPPPSDIDHSPGRQFAKERDSSGVEERGPVEIEHETMPETAGAGECLVAHATQLVHPLSDHLAFNLESVGGARVRVGDVRDLQPGSGLPLATAMPDPIKRVHFALSSSAVGN